MEGLISVIVPGYNHSAYVGNALESVRAQTAGRIELIFIDDCSSDGTYDAALALASQPGWKERFDNVWIGKNDRNLGAAATINKGLAQARGEWLTILNSDDFYAPERFVELFAAMGKTGSHFAISGVAVVDANGAPHLNDEYAASRAVMADRVEAYPSIGFAIFEENIAHSSGNLFFSRALYQKTGNFADIRLSHDWDYLLRLLAFEEPAFAPGALYLYRIHGNNSYVALNPDKAFDPSLLMYRYALSLEQGNFENPLYPLYRRVCNENLFNYYNTFFEFHRPDYHVIAERINWMIKNG